MKPISITDAARVAAMSERHFLRRFKAHADQAEAIGIFIACAARCELHVVRRDGLAKIFRKRLSISPMEYRLAGRRKQ